MQAMGGEKGPTHSREPRVQSLSAQVSLTQPTCQVEVARYPNSLTDFRFGSRVQIS